MSLTLQESDGVLCTTRESSRLKTLFFVPMIQSVGSHLSYALPWAGIQISPVTQVMYSALAAQEQTDVFVRRTAFGKKSDPVSPLYQYAQALSQEYRAEYERLRPVMDRLFQGIGTLYGRPKSQESTLDKLQRAHQKHPISSLEDARLAVGDGLGFCLVLDNPGKQGVDEAINRLQEAIKNRKLWTYWVKNTQGKEGLPYLAPGNVEGLVRTARWYNSHPSVKAYMQAYDQWARHEASKEHPWINVSDQEQGLRASGYTAAMFELLYPSADKQSPLTSAQLQIRGPVVDKVYRVEHVLYRARQGKDLPPRYHALAKLIHGMSEQQYAQFLKYMTTFYNWARRAELQMPYVGQQPELPKELREHRSLLSIPSMAETLGIHLSPA